jgi:hypothetical protein
MQTRAEIVEEELGVKIPAQYAAFLEKYGIYEHGSCEVYGVHENLLGYDGIPCVIGATKLFRKHYNLPHKFLLIHETGVEDEIICLDTESGEVRAFSQDFGDRKVADSFDEWFERDIIEFYKDSGKPNKYTGQKIIFLD